MNLDHFEAIHAARDLGLRLAPSYAAAVEVSVHPPFTDLRSVQTVLEAEGIPAALGAQNCAVEDSGAFTGEVSPLMLAKLHVQYVIVGHSERRRLFGETDEVVAAKLRAVLRNGMTPIVCVGETLDERSEGQTRERLAGQVEAAIGGLAPEAVASLVVAYEPIWAIGTGEAALPGGRPGGRGLDPGGGGGHRRRRAGRHPADPVRGVGERRQHRGAAGRSGCRRGPGGGRQPRRRHLRGHRAGCRRDRPVTLLALPSA